MQTRKEDIKLLLLAHGMTIYRNDPKTSTMKLLQLINTVSNVAASKHFKFYFYEFLRILYNVLWTYSILTSSNSEPILATILSNPNLKFPLTFSIHTSIVVYVVQLVLGRDPPWVVLKSSGFISLKKLDSPSLRSLTQVFNQILANFFVILLYNVIDNCFTTSLNKNLSK